MQIGDRIVHVNGALFSTGRVSGESINELENTILRYSTSDIIILTIHRPTGRDAIVADARPTDTPLAWDA